MRHPLEVAISPEARGNALLFLLALTVILFATLYELGGGLTTDKAGDGIVSFQLAGEPLASAAILNSWAQKPPALTTAQTVLVLDYAFLLVYSTTLTLACIWASSFWSNRRMAGLGKWLAWGGLLSGILNAVQDFALLRILLSWTNPGLLPLAQSAPAQFATSTARFCALAKFGLVEAGLLYIVASGIEYSLGERLRFSGSAAK